ncbi:MAG: hypothetical protein L6420_00650, partial [Elusimicrobia bacterium]|nr:hypothetical protein [Elusimicrobiota bacterium]
TIETPTTIVFDEITYNAITASAYAATPGFNNLQSGLSGINVAIDGAYAGWHTGGNIWITKTVMPTGRDRLAVVAVGGKIYAVGGAGGTQKQNEEYDPVANTWTTKADMPIAQYWLTAVAVGGKLYAIGGYDGGGLNTNQEYDPAANNWVTKAVMPTARYGLAAAVVGGKIYAVGGVGGTQKENEEYDPETNIWTTKAVMPIARHYFAAAVVGGKLYAIGGEYSGYLSANEEYDPTVDAWVTRANMPTARYQLAAATAGGKIYVIGGSGGTTRNEEYDPGVAQEFTGLIPNTEYDFKAKAMDMNGAETAETVTVSTYTMAYVSGPASFSDIYPSSITVAWSTGSASIGYNGPGATYLVQASMLDNFAEISGSSQTANIFAAVEGLSPPSTFYFRVKAANSLGAWGDYIVLGSTANGSSAPINPVIAAVYKSSITVSYGAVAGVDGYAIEASIKSDFSLILYSSSTGNNLLETLTVQNIAQNATYYMRAGSLIGMATDYANTAPPTATLTIETPKDIVFDEITYGAITASAYVATPGFSNLESGLSGINVAKDGAYAGWHTGGNTWTTKTVMPTGRAGLAAVTVGGKIYAITSAKNEEYDPAANTWTTKAVMPTARNQLAAAAAGGKIYAIGGYASGYRNTNEEYDTVANIWTTKAVMPTARNNLSAAVVGGKIYVIGGYTGSSSNKNEEYDPAANAWTGKAVMPTARYALAAAAVGGKVYIIGGYSGTQNVNEEYDPVANAWTTKAIMPIARHALAAATVGGKIYVIGGYRPPTYPYLNTNEEYDPAANIWAIKADIPTARYSLAAAAAGGKIYAIGGTGGTNKNEEYDPGVAQKFTGLIPNMEYDFKAKAMDMNGAETAETVTVSTYTMAYVSGPASFSDIYPSSVTVAWSSGSASIGYNGPGATYMVQASNLANFNTIKGSSETLNSFAAIEGLSPPTTYYFRVKAANSLGVWSDYIVIGSTRNGSAAPVNPIIAAVYESSVTVSYGIVAGVDGYVAEASTTTDFNFIIYFSSVAGDSVSALTVRNMERNAMYYMRAGSLMGQATEYANTAPAAATFTIETPTNIVFDEITYGAITASAYAATPGFTNLQSGLSGINVAKGGSYAGWHTGGDAWTTKADMPTARNSLAAAIVGGKIYAIGGQGGTQKENEEYDPVANTWTTKAVMPTARNSFAAAAVGGKIYAIGGYEGGYLDINEEYDPVANEWTTKAAMPTSRNQLAAAAVGGKLYAIGGQNGTTINEEYDPETNTWLTKAVMPTARYQLTATAVGGKLYAMGGEYGTSLNTNEEYDPAANSWTTKTIIPTARQYFAAVAVGGKIYAIGGFVVLNINEEYDPAVDAWATKTIIPTARRSLATAAVGGKLYAIGGYGGTQKENEEYDPGVAQKFTELIPNTEYDFKAKAMNFAGTETDESITVSTYTLAYSAGPALFSDIYASSVTVAWSTGSASIGYNGPGAIYLVQASRLDNFGEISGSSQTANIFAAIEGLSPPSTFYFRVKAANSLGVWGDYIIIGSTANGSSAPGNPVIAAVYESSVTVNYGAVADIDGYIVEASSVSDFSVILYSSSTGDNLLETLTVQDMELNTTYYMRAGSLIGQATDYANTTPLSATLPIETPKDIFFDEITFSTIAASAYVATPGFSNLQSGLSGINVAIDGAYAGWHTGGNTWTTKAVMPTARYEFAAAAVGGKIYAIGGGGPTNKNEEYDLVANTWTTKAEMPTARRLLSAAAIGGKIYAIGGVEVTYSSKNEEYDPASNTWTTKAVLPTARRELSAAAIGGKIYAIGGQGGTRKENEEYDPENNTWTTKAVMPTARQGFAAAAAGGKLYAMGGNTATDKENEEYDPAVNAWTTKAAMPTPRYLLAAAAVGGKIYAIGGSIGSPLWINVNTTEEYDPVADVWVTRVAMPAARYNLAAAAASGKVYAVGGAGGTQKQNEEYDPGVFQEFTGLIPNTEYSFKAKARNVAATETAEVTVSTYTLAYSSGAVFGDIYTSSVAVSWSSGTALLGYNGSGATYLVEASRLANFAEILGSSETLNIFATIEGLSPPGTFYFRIKAANNLNVWNQYVVFGSTCTGSAAPVNPVISAVYESSVTVSYGAVEEVDGYVVEASTMTDFSGVVYSSSTANNLLEILTVQNMAQNATYYMRAGSLIGMATDYANTDPPTATLPIEAPTDIIFDEITFSTITASAYAATPGFSNLQSGLSATNVAIDETYAGWHTGGNTWTTKAVMPTARAYLSAAAVGGKIYAIGGTPGPTNKNEEYDPVANNWATKADMPTARNWFAAATVGGKIYAIGGDAGTRKQNEEYDPVTDAWATKEVMPTARYFLAAAAVGDKIYAIGGDSATDKENEEYDPATDVWTTKAVMPTARYGLVVVAVGGNIYAIGGIGGTQKENEEYDPETNIWTTKAVMPTARYILAAAAVGGKVYVIGGYGGTKKENEEYDTVANTWVTKFDMPTSRDYLSAAAVGGKIYAIGGSPGPTNKNEEYDPGVLQEFTGLIPNTEYDFKAKARNMAAIETAESITVSTYTLAYSSGPAVFTGIYPSSIAVSWSSGTPSLGYNGTGATYLVQASRLNDFGEISGSSQTYNAFATIEGLSPPGTFYFRLKAANNLNVWNQYVVFGSTANGSSAPVNPVISAVYVSSVTVSYGAVADVDGYIIEASTKADFSGAIYSSTT